MNSNSGDSMKRNIAIIAGGDSSEYDVSMNTADVVRRNLDSASYNGYLIRIRGMVWECIDEKGNAHPVRKDDFTADLNGTVVSFDCIFVAIHGSPAEDGKILGYFDMLGIPYTSSGVVTAAITFDKYLCIQLVRAFGIRSAPSYLVRRKEEADLEAVVRNVGVPCFVKPNRGGSSLGITRVFKEKDLGPAIEKAFEEDSQVLVEHFIEGREITCGVMMMDGKIHAFPITEIVSKNDFFDYEAKYTKGMADEITPAPIPKYMELNCRDKSVFLYEKLNCRGFVRFDFIFTSEDMFFLEINTVPGLAETSILPQQAAAEDISLRQLFSIAIEEALK